MCEGLGSDRSEAGVKDEGVMDPAPSCLESDRSVDGNEGVMNPAAGMHVRNRFGCGHAHEQRTGCKHTLSAQTGKGEQNPVALFAQCFECACMQV
eukprot:366569-Chlamydomonas_euryale.AAC.20